MKTFKLLFVVLLLLLLPVTLAGCSEIGYIAGSGDVITRQYDLSNFNEIEVSNNFEIEITSASTYSVSVTTNENLFDHLDISQSGNVLMINMKPGSFTNASRLVKVTLPELNRLSLSGASHGSSRGFNTSNNFVLQLSGASRLDLDMGVGNSQIDISGASNLTGRFTTLESDMQISGASQARLTGSGNSLTLEVSGASQANLEEFPLLNADVEVSGASRASVNVSGTLDVSASGASTVNYSGNPTLGNVNITGASNLRSSEAN